MILLTFAFVLIVASSDFFDRYVRAVRAAMEKSRTPFKAVAADMGEQAPQLSREFAGVGHVSLTRMARVSDIEFHRRLALELVAEFGLPSDVVLAQAVERAL